MTLWRRPIAHLRRQKNADTAAVLSEYSWSMGTATRATSHRATLEFQPRRRISGADRASCQNSAGAAQHQSRHRGPPHRGMPRPRSASRWPGALRQLPPSRAPTRLSQATAKFSMRPLPEDAFCSRGLRPGSFPLQKTRLWPAWRERFWIRDCGPHRRGRASQRQRTRAQGRTTPPLPPRHPGGKTRCNARRRSRAQVSQRQGKRDQGCREARRGGSQAGEDGPGPDWLGMVLGSRGTKRRIPDRRSACTGPRAPASGMPVATATPWHQSQSPRGPRSGGQAGQRMLNRR